MIYQDEPVPGYPLPIREGHSSPGRLERLLRDGQFVVTTEIAPPDSADPGIVYERASLFDGYVDAINATDGSGAHCHMGSLAVCSLLTRLGHSLIMQISCRDKNRIAIQGDILGGAAMGVCNILCLSGDGVQTGDHPQAKPVFDLDCMSLLEIARNMRDQQMFQSGRKLVDSPKVFLGAAANPFAEPYDWRPERLAKKIVAGAQFVQTQYCYDVPRLRSYLQAVKELGLQDKVFILVGVGPLASARAAEFIRSNVPGVRIPDSVINRLNGADDQKAEGVKLCIELIEEIKELEGVHGVHVMAYRMEQYVPEIVDRSGVLDGRTPWHPKVFTGDVTVQNHLENL